MTTPVENLLKEIRDAIQSGSGAPGLAETEAERITARRAEDITSLEATISLNERLAAQETDKEKRLRLQISLAEEGLRLERLRAVAAQEAGNAADFDAAVQSARDYNVELEKLQKQLKTLPENPFQDWYDLDNTEKLRRFTSKITTLGNEMRSGGNMVGAMDGAMGNLLTSVGSLDGFNIASAVLGSFTSITANAIAEADKLRSSFVALTGEAGASRNMFIDLTLASSDLALSFEEMQASQVALREGFVDFVFLSDATRASLTLQTATMTKLGVDAGITAESINTLTQAFGMNHDEAIQTQRDMIGLGTALGIPPQVIAQEFAKAMPALAEFGAEATEVFESLVVASRETGLGVQELMSTFGDAMNTYQASTKVAGQLNAVLGSGIISGTELLMGDAEERFRIVQQGLELTGKSFQDLERYERITFAQAAGFRSVDEAARAFSNTQEDLATRIGDTAVSQEQMEELARQATDSFTQLKFAMMSFAVAIQPLTEGFAIMVDKFIEFGSAFPGGVAGLISAVTAAAGALSFVVGAVMTLTGVGAMPGMGLMAGGAAMVGAGAAGGGALALSGAVDDAIIRGNKVIPINSRDDIVAAKPGGPLSAVMKPLSPDVPVMRDTPMASQVGETIAKSIKEALAPLTSQPRAQTDPPRSAVEPNKQPVVVKVMLNEREMGQAIVPHIDRRVLGAQ